MKKCIDDMDLDDLTEAEVSAMMEAEDFGDMVYDALGCAELPSLLGYMRPQHGLTADPAKQWHTLQHILDGMLFRAAYERVKRRVYDQLVCDKNKAECARLEHMAFLAEGRGND